MGNPIPMKSTCKLANEAGNENEHVQFWKRAKEADQNFCLAMRHAIATGKENPLIGVDKRPGTQNPITIGPAFVPVGGSSIGLCADIGSDKGRGHKW